MMNSFHPRRLIAFSILCAIYGLLLAPSARADIPRSPKPAPKQDTVDTAKSDPQLVITSDGDTKVAHLRLPKSVVRQLTPQGQGQPRSDSGISPARTVVAGLALTSALAISGLFLVRGRFGRGRNLVIVAIVGSVGVLTTMVVADVPPFNPNSPRWHQLPPAPSLDNASMPVVIETIDDGPIQLVLPKDQAAKVAQLPTTQPSGK